MTKIEETVKIQVAIHSACDKCGATVYSKDETLCHACRLKVRLRSGEQKAITILDVAIARGANQERLTMGEFIRLGLPLIGGCQRCEACIAAYNAAPSKTGYIMCADSCIGDLGFPSVDAYTAWERYKMAVETALTELEEEGATKVDAFAAFQVYEDETPPTKRNS